MQHKFLTRAYIHTYIHFVFEYNNIIMGKVFNSLYYWWHKAVTDVMSNFMMKTELEK